MPASSGSTRAKGVTRVPRRVSSALPTRSQETTKRPTVRSAKAKPVEHG
jgi:hypothetical protein